MTSDDVLWLARGFVGECGEDCTREEAQWHFWSWMDRFLLWRGAAKLPTFAALLRSHSQALNPLWMTVGEGKCAQFPDDCSTARIARRQYVCSLSPSQLQGFGVWTYAVEAAEGKLLRPVKEPIYDFASCELVAKQGRSCTGYSYRGQCFLPFDCLKTSERAAVLEGEVSGYPTSGALLKTVAVGGFLAAVGWALWTLKPWERLGR